MPEYFYVPYPHDHRFVGRSEELAATERALAAKTWTMIGGEPGIGKTALAVQAAYGLRHAYDAVLWFDCRSTLEEQYATVAGCIAKEDSTPERPITGPDNLTSIRDALAGRKSLLIFDGASEDVVRHPLVPRAPGRSVLITTTDPMLRLDVTLGPLSLEDGARLILSGAYRQDVKSLPAGLRLAAVELSGLLHNTPYWLVRAGAQLAAGMEPSDLLRALRTDYKGTLEGMRTQQLRGQPDT